MIPLPSPELLARHQAAGPRYTSYPAATEWTPAFGAAQLEEKLVEANRSRDPLSLYVHLPFCPEMCRFCGCNVIATNDRGRADLYLDTLDRELELWASRLPDRRGLGQLHLGGGTPTFLRTDQLARLFSLISSRFTINPDAELAVEVDPAITTREQLALLGSLGFTRLSVGIQDLDPTVQQAINRFQTAEQTRETIEAARASGFDGVNVDLIYGLPHQTPESFAATIERVLELGPDRVALFGYAHVPWMKPNQRLLPQAALPGPHARVRLFVTAARRLEEAGFTQIGLDHFARAGDPLAKAQRLGTLTRNFQGYAVHAAEDTIACGVSGISDVAGAFAQGSHKLAEWEAAIAAGRFPIERGLVRTADDELRGGMIRMLMCLLRVDVPSLEARYGEEARHVFGRAQPALQALSNDGFLKLHDDGLVVLPMGRLFLRNIAMVFDGHLREAAARPAFSQTV